jgi:hypothetical protein
MGVIWRPVGNVGESPEAGADAGPVFNQRAPASSLFQDAVHDAIGDRVFGEQDTHAREDVENVNAGR